MVWVHGMNDWERRARRWPVLAWVRLRLPPSPPPVLLTPGAAPPPNPPLQSLTRTSVPTDPRKRVYGWLGPWKDGAIHLRWDADSPEFLEVELRAPRRRNPGPGEVEEFWDAVRPLLMEVGPLKVDGADPWPRVGRLGTEKGEAGTGGSPGAEP